MKRFAYVLILLSLILICTSISVFADADRDFYKKFIGTWYLEQLDFDGVLFDATVLGLTDVQAVLNGDGTGELIAAGSPTHGKWRVEGANAFFEVSANEIYQMEINEKGRLVMTADDGGMMVFGPVQMSVEEQAAPKEDAVFEDYLGEWVLDAVGSGDMYYTLEQTKALGLDLGFDISFTLTESFGLVYLDGEISGLFNPRMDGSTLVLEKTVDDEALDDLAAVMLEDGRIRIALDDSDLYFVRSGSNDPAETCL